MKILICGSRNWTDHGIIKNFLSQIPQQSTIIHGDCRGADKIAAEIALSLGMKVITFPANWKNEGRSAGPKRNMRMLKEGNPDLVVAFHESIETSKGTKDMIEKASKMGVAVKIISK